MFKFFEISNSRRSIVLYSFFAVFLAGIFTAIYFAKHEAYAWFNTEDALIENLTALFFFIAGFNMIVSGLLRRKKGERTRHLILTILIGVFLFFVAGEEISWGQRIFHFSSQGFMKTYNLQNEFGLHNLDQFDRNFLYPDFLGNVAFFLTGVLFPLIYMFIRKIRIFFNMIHFPVIPVSCLPFFFLPLFIGQGLILPRIILNDARLGAVYYDILEVKEFMFSLGWLFFSISVMTLKNYLPLGQKRNRREP
jgi:hypothetical protein